MGNCRSKREDSIDETSEAQKDGLNLKPKSQNSNSKLESHIVPMHSTLLSSLPPDAPLFDSKDEKTSNDYVIDSTRTQVNCLLLRIHEFYGTKENDKSYRYLDEMLTRCILELDKIECNNSTDRSNRKQLIKNVNQAISILERKLEINSDIEKLEVDLSED